MANYCWYQVRAKGKKKNIKFLYYSMPIYDSIDELLFKDEGDNSTIIFRGSCKWSLDSYCDNSSDDIKINVDEFIDEKGNEIKDTSKYIYYTLQDKSKLLNCEIEVFSEYEDYNIDLDVGDRPLFQHFKNGEKIDEENLPFNDAQQRADELFGIKKVIPNYFSYDEDFNEFETYNVFPFTVELTESQLNGGIERAEKIKVGDSVKLIREENEEIEYEKIRVEHELGFIGYLGFYSSDVAYKMENTNGEEPHAKISKVIPLSKRNSRCKKPLIEVEVYIENEKQIKDDNQNEDNNKEERITVFLEKEVIEKFYSPNNNDSVKNYLKQLKAKYNLIINAIQLPLVLFVTHKEDKIEFIDYIRDEIESNRIVNDEFNVVGENVNVVKGQNSAQISLLFNLGVYTSKVLEENKDKINYKELYDKNDRGILITLDNNGEFKLEVIKGKERPEVACFSPITGSVSFLRPYQDEELDNYMQGLNIKFDTEEEIEELEPKANNGDAEAQGLLAEKYMLLGNQLYGDDDKCEEYDNAIKWAKEAIKNDNSYGYYILALSYDHGRGVVRDDQKAFEQYEKGANKGNANCEHSLGVYYINGKIVQKNEKKAFELFKSSANKGYALAMTALGSCYQQGAGTEYNLKKAIEWYEKSLEINYDDELYQKILVYKSMLDEESDSIEELFIDEDVNYEELIKLMKDGKNKMKTEIEGFHNIVEEQLRPIRNNERNYDLDNVVEMVKPVATEFGNNASKTIELMDKSSREPIEECNNEETIKTIARTILDTIKYLDEVVINWGFRGYYPNYRYYIPKNVLRIKNYWENKLDNLPSIKKEKEEQKRKAEENKERIQKIKECWEKDCEDIKQKRKNDLDVYTKNTRKEYDDKIENSLKEIDDEIENIKIQKNSIKQEIKEQEEELSKLFLLNFGKKTELKNDIEKNNLTLIDLDKSIKLKEEDKKTIKHNLEKEYEKTISDYFKELSNKYPFHAKPKELIDANIKTIDPEPIPSQIEKENNRIKEVIINAIIDLCKPVRIVDLQEYSDELNKIPFNKMISLLSELVSEQKLEKFIHEKKAYYILKD